MELVLLFVSACLAAAILLLAYAFRVIDRLARRIADLEARRAE